MPLISPLMPVPHSDASTPVTARLSELTSLLSSLYLGAVELWELTEEKDCLRSVARPVEHDDIVSCVSVNSSSAKFVSAGHDNT